MMLSINRAADLPSAASTESHCTSPKVESCLSAVLAVASRRLAMTTFTPWRAKAPAVVRPIPLLPPVKSATLPCMSGLIEPLAAMMR